MRRRSIGEHHPLECPMCCGLFVASTELESLIADQKDQGDAAAASLTRPERASLMIEDVAYLKCPLCSTMMNRVNYGRLSGVIIDSCKEHGHWLDEGELEKIARWIATGGLVKLRQREMDELRAERERLSSAQSAPSGYSAPISISERDSAFGLFGGTAGGVVRLLANLFFK